MSSTISMGIMVLYRYTSLAVVTERWVLWYPYYRFEALSDNKEFVMIANDNKEMKFFPYYRFEALSDNKEVCSDR